jgi:hypothetical protein
VDCTLVHYGELWPTSQKAHQTVWEDVSVGLSYSYMSATPIFFAFYVSATATTSRSRGSSSTEPIWIGFEALRSGVGELYFGPLQRTLAYFPKFSPHHLGRHLC